MAANPMVIPVGERYGNLKELLLKYVAIVTEIRGRSAQLAQQFPQFFLYLSFPWVADPALLNAVQGAAFDQRKREIAALNFDGEKTRRELETVLANDRHLAACCPTLLHLV